MRIVSGRVRVMRVVRAEVRAHPALVNFWATWCPQRGELPLIALKISEVDVGLLDGGFVGFQLGDRPGVLRSFERGRDVFGADQSGELDVWVGG